jgi:hypothetical protein
MVRGICRPLSDVFKRLALKRAADNEWYLQAARQSRLMQSGKHASHPVYCEKYRIVDTTMKVLGILRSIIRRSCQSREIVNPKICDRNLWHRLCFVFCGRCTVALRPRYATL